MKIETNRYINISDAIESTGALVNAEMLIKAKQRGYSWKEVGVHHYPRLKGRQTGAKLSVIFRMFKELFILRKKLKYQDI